MSIKKPIVVKIDQKRVAFKQHKLADSYSSKATSHEQAATTENSNQEIQPYTREYPEHTLPSSYKNKKTQFRNVRPIVIAAVSAVVIGSILGVILLNMFVNIDELTSNGNSNQVGSIGTVDTNDQDDQSESNDKGNSSEGSLKTLPAMNAFVLQGGVFSEETNASDEANRFEQEGYTPVIWEQDEQFYLLVGLSDSKEHAKSLAETLDSHNLEVFVKDWTSPELELDLSEEEREWFQSVQEQWQKSLASISEQESMVLHDWESILETHPQGSDKVDSFIQSSEPILSNLQEANNTESQTLLLKMWKALNKLGE
ncbi:SPOR domain-containing protein [Ornithinibacillus salinisoli]|uniref:SPOR domain-containing protein n=1 Tax=Ornithinibacillus salinisoli TaxID=1848459 RepID=A0ABW4W3V4_9BACI